MDDDAKDAIASLRGRRLSNADQMQGRPISATAPSHGHVPGWNATTKKWEPVPGVTIIDRELTEVDVETTAVETSIYSHSVAADSMGTTGGFRLTLGGNILKNNAGNLILKVKFGATTVFESAAIDPTDNASRYRWHCQVSCLNSAANAQIWVALWDAIIGSAAWAWQRDDVNLSFHGAGYAGSSEDTTAAKTLDVTVKWSVSHANLSFLKRFALLELLAEV